MTFKQAVKDVVKGLIVAFIAVGVFFIAVYIPASDENTPVRLLISFIAIIMFMWALKISKGTKEVRIVK